MPKNIVVLCDGTSNEISTDRTNILRLFGTLEKSDRQIVFYDPGVGTFGAENAWSYRYRRLIEIWGLVTGWGLDRNVKEAYRFIVENYDNGKRGKGKAAERDRIYIFGFSRGAYTARVLAGFIHTIGLIDRVNLNLLDYAYRAYKRIGDRATDRATDGAGDEAGADPAAAGSSDHRFSEVRLYERLLQTDRPPIRCLGLFDTVASIVEWGRFGPRFRSHAHTKTNRSVETVRHAVAIQERRTMFQPKLWPPQGEYWGNPFNREAAREQDAKEVWFTGVHGDVGGGYPEQASALAKIPLDWMIRETAAAGLHFKTLTINEIVLGKNEKKKYISPDACGVLNRSMNWAWSVLEICPRRAPADGAGGKRKALGLYIPFFEPRRIPPSALLHRSVEQRATKSGEPLPANIPPDHVVVD